MLLPNLAPVPPGTSGAVSAEGTAAGLLGALALAALGAAVGLIPFVRTARRRCLGATIGSFAESVLGATLEAPGIVNNDVLNFPEHRDRRGAAVLLVRSRFNEIGQSEPSLSSSSRVRSRWWHRRSGFASGAATAAGAAPRESWSPDLLLYPVIGLVMAAVLNAASNALNQIYDLEIDRINKPKRALPSGRLLARRRLGVHARRLRRRARARVVRAPGGRHECFWIVVVATIITVLYSAPPFRTKRLGIWANVTIAIPRGVLLKVAGWSAVKTIVGTRALVHRRDLRSVSARRLDDEGFRGHGRRRARRMPHACRSSTASSRGLDDLSVVRRAVRHDRRRHVVRILTGTPALLYLLVGRHDALRRLGLLPDAAQARGSCGRGKSRFLGAHVSNDVRRADRICVELPVVANECV